MAFFLVIMIFLAVVAAITVPIIVLYNRRQARDLKSFERGLKMVPMLIHLPPISDDTDLGGRDVRDITEENISRAQTIYNIMVGTFEKGFKRRLYGQQHFAFEILSAQGFVYFYTTVPVGLVEVARQAIVSAYPSARLEEVEEHNIFSPVGRATATTGGELVLKESFSYPIATYLDSKRDAMQAMLNALSTVGKEDGAAIQILMRPADPGWRREAHELVKNKRSGEDDKGGGAKALGVARDFASAFVKPPDDKDGGSDKPELSNLDEQILQSIEDKTRYPAFEVLIRVVASSNVTQRSQAIVAQIVSSFSLFDAQGKNGFKFEPAKDADELVTSYIMKFFPQKNNEMILNSVELATIFHFPDQRSIPTSQLERQDSKQVDGPRNMPEDGLLLGYNMFRGVKKPIRLGLSDRQRHMYVVGQTGTGKSTFLENLALQDMMNGNGFAFVDPHGDTAEKLLSMVPKERSEDIIYFCPADMEYPMGLNLFEYQNPDQKDFLIQEALNMLKKLYDPNNQGIMGPRYEHLFRNAALTVMADPAGGTFIDIPKLFRDPQYVKQKLQYVKDLNVLEFWQKEMPQSQRSNEFGEVVSWFVSKFGAFLSNEMMRNIIGQTKSAFNLRDIMDNKKILLVNLSKGRTGDLNSKLLGMVFVMQFQAAAMSRANIPESERVDFSLYVDEFQNFSTESFATIMSEARKFRLNLIVANQFTTQLSEEIRDAVFGNIGTIVAFRIGQNDVDSLSRYFQPTFDGDDLLRVPNYNSIVRTLVGGVPTQPFSMAALPPLGAPNAELGKALKQLSAAKYGRPKAEVEREIFARIATKEEPAGFGSGAAGAGAGGQAAQRPFGAPGSNSPWGRPAAPTAAGGFGQNAGPAGGAFGAQQRPFGAAAPAGNNFATPAGGAGQPAPAASRPAPRTGTGSFLDEWLTKRDPNAPATSAPARPVPAAAAPASTPATAQPAAAMPPMPGPGPMPPFGVPPAAPAVNNAVPNSAANGASLPAANPADTTGPDTQDQEPLVADTLDDMNNTYDAPTQDAQDDAVADEQANQPDSNSPEADDPDDNQSPDQDSDDATDDEASADTEAIQPIGHGAAEDDDKPRKKRKKRRNKRKKADGADGQQDPLSSIPGLGSPAKDGHADTGDASQDDTRPPADEHATGKGRRDNRPATAKTPHDPTAGVVEIGNHYDRNRMPGNHTVIETPHPTQAAVPVPAPEAPVPTSQPFVAHDTDGQADTDGHTSGTPEDQLPVPNELQETPYPVVGPPAETPPAPVEPAPEEAAVAAGGQANRSQPSNEQSESTNDDHDDDWLPHGGPDPRTGSGPQPAYPDEVSFMDQQAPRDTNWQSPTAAAGSAPADSQAAPADAGTDGPADIGDNPDLDDLKRLAKPGKHLNHGDTIYIDKNGQLKPLAPEEAGTKNGQPAS